MSREAFGDPPEQQEVPECCPNCGSDFYMPGCMHCEEVKRRCAAESEALALRGQLGAASGWIVKALKVLDAVDPDDTDEAERLTALVKAGEMLALTTLASGPLYQHFGGGAFAAMSVLAAVGGIVLVLMGWLGVKAYGRAAERKGAAEAEQRQRAANAAARERMAAVPKPSADETVEIMRRGGM